MALNIDTSRPLRTQRQLGDLLTAIDGANASDESYSVEWKSAFDLRKAAGHFPVAKCILGMGNRPVRKAKAMFEGCAYMVVGMEPGSVLGVDVPDYADLQPWIETYTGADGPDWSPQQVTYKGVTVLVITVESPRDGDQAHPLRKTYSPPPKTADGRKPSRGYSEGTLFVRHLMTSNPAGIIGHRDWAILIMGFAGAFQRSELATLTFSDIQPGDRTGIRLRIRTAKATRTGRGAYKLLPFGQSPESCPACALFRGTRILATAQDRERFDVEQVLAETALTDHLCREAQPQIQTFDPLAPILRPVLRGGHIQAHQMSGDVVNDVVKRRLGAAGMDPTRIGSHSLRAGFVREALRAGHAPTAVMLQTDHANALSIEKYRSGDEPSGRNPVLDMGF